VLLAGDADRFDPRRTGTGPCSFEGGPPRRGILFRPRWRRRRMRCRTSCDDCTRVEIADLYLRTLRRGIDTGNESR